MIHNFVVTVSVDEVLAGELSGPTFDCSPCTVLRVAGLCSSAALYTIKGKWKRGGYVV